MIDNLLKSTVFVAVLMAAAPADAGLSAGFAGLRAVTVGGSLTDRTAAICIAERSEFTHENLEALVVHGEYFDI